MIEVRVGQVWASTDARDGVVAVFNSGYAYLQTEGGHCRRVRVVLDGVDRHRLVEDVPA